ncbi:MAG TPA: cupredoxin domain-containing protein [Candidatus Nanoarchaeia archaeon]|nr:cupredoxin domain-containing protein [Candidatus Nanoarchaeia archaeon]
MKKLIIGMIVMLLIIAGIFFIKSTPEKVIEQSDSKEFTVKAFKYGYSPDLITVNKGDKVRIIIDNTDVLHGIRIPDLAIKGNEILEFTANKEGEFSWYCTNMCGEGHMQMQGKLIVK